MSRGALRFLLRRLAWAVGVVLAVVSLTFVVNHALPSDAAQMIAGPQARPADVARIRTQLGLDRSLAVQFRIFARRLVHLGPSSFERSKDASHANCGHLGPVHLDLGRSYQARRPVIEILVKKLPYTAALALAGTCLSVLIGVSSGILAALRKGSWVDATSVAVAVVGVSTPTFILGVALQYVFAYQLEWLPLNGAGETISSHAVHLILPALTLGIFGAAYYTRMVRSELLELLRHDYVRTARAKGASVKRVVVVHALRNALVPLVTAIGLEFGGLLSGAVITEQVFSWPGLGSLAVRSVRDRDGPLLMGTVLVGAVSIVVANVAVDFAYALLDPRIRRQ